MEAKNSLMFEFADVIVTGNYAISYERQVYSNKSFRSMINLGFGGWYSFNHYNDGHVDMRHVASSYSVPFTLNTIKGFGKHHFECDLGVRFIMGRSWSIFQDNGVVEDPPKLDNSNVKPIFNVGYRFQKPNGKFILRTFIGLGGFGLGIGRAF